LITSALPSLEEFRVKQPLDAFKKGEASQEDLFTKH